MSTALLSLLDETHLKSTGFIFIGGRVDHGAGKTKYRGRNVTLTTRRYLDDVPPAWTCIHDQYKAAGLKKCVNSNPIRAGWDRDGRRLSPPETCNLFAVDPDDGRSPEIQHISGTG